MAMLPAVGMPSAWHMSFNALQRAAVLPAGDLAVSLFGLGQSEIRSQRCVALQVAIIPADSVKDGLGYK
jgi:hypothetical protein